jgi:hypothetical protein
MSTSSRLSEGIYMGIKCSRPKEDEDGNKVKVTNESRESLVSEAADQINRMDIDNEKS